MSPDSLHPRDRAQSWADCDPDVRAYVLAAVDAMAVDVLGAYVHGSLAMGCYYRAKSDLDVLVVVPSGLTCGRASARDASARSTGC